MRSCLSCLLVGLMLVGWNGEVWPAEPDADALQALIEKSAEQFSSAFKDRDPQKIAALFTPEAEYIDASGTVFHGREAIAAEYAASFAIEPPGELTIEILSIRPIAPGVVVEEGTSTFQSVPEGPSQTSSPLRYTATHVRQSDGTWLLASVRELETPPQMPREYLKELAWLVGAWREEVGGTSVNTEWKWTEDGNFLISEFTVKDSQEITLKGTQRVGWDGERKQFRSWVFDSTGGSAEGWWSASDEGTWGVQLGGVDAQGARTSCILTYFQDGADGLIITQDQRTRNGSQLPSITHRVVRCPPSPASSAKQ